MRADAVYAAFREDASQPHCTLNAIVGKYAKHRSRDRSVAFAAETRMLDVLMLALVAASFALLGLYLTACERS